KEVAAMTAAKDEGVLSKVESCIDSETSLRLSAAKDKYAAIQGASVTLKDGVTLELKDLVVDSGSTIDGKSATVAMHNSTLVLTEANTDILQSRSLPVDTLLQYGNPENTLQLSAVTPVLELKTHILTGALTICGSSITVDFRGLERLPSFGIVCLEFDENIKFTNPGELQVNAVTDRGQLAAYYNPENANCMYFVIPEPSAPALSLLALAGLAARRRRR
ncbi:MAG: PEP-CTERM sorting domain-containing protein, partial [Akkermansia sp.]|nr:PEP-CTERM sorting domain-containing protein [Akkermansia sp.]